MIITLQTPLTLRAFTPRDGFYHGKYYTFAYNPQECRYYLGAVNGQDGQWNSASTLEELMEASESLVCNEIQVNSFFAPNSRCTLAPVGDLETRVIKALDQFAKGFLAIRDLEDEVLNAFSDLTPELTPFPFTPFPCTIYTRLGGLYKGDEVAILPFKQQDGSLTYKAICVNGFEDSWDTGDYLYIMNVVNEVDMFSVSSGIVRSLPPIYTIDEEGIVRKRSDIKHEAKAIFEKFRASAFGLQGLRAELHHLINQ